MRNCQQFLVAMGSNVPSEVGSRRQTLDAALQQLEQRGIRIQTVSRFYRTPCFPAGAGPDYVNAAALLHSCEPAARLLRYLHEVEAEFGRERLKRWGQRTLDLDLIAAGQSIFPDVATYERWRDLPLDQQVEEAPEDLILPHPRLQDRAFVLVPLSDIAPDWCHPVLKKTVSEMLAALPFETVSKVVPCDP